MKVEYVTLSYYPHTFNVEHINVGFILHDIESGELLCRFIKKKNRWLEFDDRLTKELIDNLINSTKRVFDQTFDKNSELSIFGSNPLSDWKYKAGYFDFIARNFQNQIRLSQSLSAEIDDSKQFFDEMCHLSLYFDYDKDNRFKESQIRSVLLKQAKGILVDSSHKFSSRVSFKNSDGDETIQFDYRFGNNYLKVINPSGENVTSCLDKAKVWAYNSRYFNSSSKLLLFVPLEDIECTNEDYYKYLKKILNDIDANVFYSAFALKEYINKISLVESF